MGHQVYTGTFAALELKWMELVSALQTADPLVEVNVLVGSNILASYLKRRLAERGSTVANLHFHTFLDLANRLAGGQHTDSKRRLPRLGASVVLDHVLASSVPAVYALLSGYSGFSEALLETFRDLRDAGIEAHALDQAIQRGEYPPDRREHLLGLADLYRRFRGQVTLFHDVDDDFRAAIHKASNGSLPGLRQLLVYGIYDATGQQSHLLSALKNSSEMIYFIPFVDEAVSGFAGPFLQARIAELQVKHVHLNREQPGNSLGRLAARGFGFIRRQDPKTGKSLQPDSSFALVSAPGESRAAIEIVREIFRAVQDGTIKGFHEAAVIMRQPESDIPILAEMFRLRGVPHFIHGGSRLSERPLSKAVLALSNLESNSCDRGSVLSAMDLVSASLPADEQSDWDVQDWRALTNDPRFLSGLQSWDEATEAVVKKAFGDLGRAESEAPELIADDEDRRGAGSIEEAKRRLDSAKSLRKGWNILRQAASGWPQSLSWGEWARFLELRLEPILGRSEDWHRFSIVLDELALLDGVGEAGSSPISLDTLKTALVKSIASLSYPAGRFQRSGVNLLSTSAARGLRFPLVIIPGLDEGRFPSKLRQDPLLLDSERRLLGNLPLKSKRIDEEKLLFDMAARSAEKRLVLMTSRLDEISDRERIPSQFFLQAASAVQGSQVSARDLAKVAAYRSVSLDAVAPPQSEIVVDEGEIRLRLVKSQPGSTRLVLTALEQAEPLRMSGPLAYDRARWNHGLTEFDGYLTDPTLVRFVALKLGSSEGQVSASRFEEYAKCPYFFFLKRIMNLNAWDEQGKVEGMDPLERGLVIHAILETFLTDFCGEAFVTTSREHLWQALESMASALLEQSKPAGAAGLLWEIERDALILMLKSWLEFERGRAADGLLASSFERAFGKFSPEQQFPGFCVTAGKHTFNLRGRIDRIDISQDGKRARVIDYKTGTLPESMAGDKRTPFMGGERIQIPIYKGALSVLKEFADVESVEGEYLHLQPRDSRPVQCSFSNRELEEASAMLPDLLEILGDGIERGLFFARTNGKVRPSGHCEYCDYLRICGKDRMQREERKQNDPLVRNFVSSLERF
jgi:ATP-dependent helicase/nuclease subunit B